MQRSARLAVAVVVVLGLTGAFALSGAFGPSGRALGSSTTLTIIAPTVEVRHGSGSFAPAIDGEVIETGDAIRTGPEGRAVLTYFDGSTVEIEPSSELVIEAASIGADGGTEIVMTQVIGHTWHVVQKQLGPRSRYEVNTPAATATVRGTTFEVLVEKDEDGEPVATVLTTEGTVGLQRQATASAPAEEVRVEAGREAAAKRGRPIEPPRPRREPERVVTVTIGSERSVVVDPLGRVNGIRDGKVVLETPGAKVERIDGKLVVTLPNVPEGALAARVEREQDGEVTVETKVRERGGNEERAEVRTALAQHGPAVVDVEVRKGERPELRARAVAARPSASVPAARLRGASASPSLRAVATPPLIPTRLSSRSSDPRLVEGLFTRSPSPSPSTLPSGSPRLVTATPRPVVPITRTASPAPSATTPAGAIADASPRPTSGTLATPTSSPTPVPTLSSAPAITTPVEVRPTPTSTPEPTTVPTKSPTSISSPAPSSSPASLTPGPSPSPSPKLDTSSTTAQPSTAPTITVMTPAPSPTTDEDASADR